MDTAEPRGASRDQRLCLCLSTTAKAPSYDSLMPPRIEFAGYFGPSDRRIPRAGMVITIEDAS